MYWNKPRDEHIIYEALSAIADGRFEMTSSTTAKCTSTSKGKFYEIEYDPSTNSIMSNDNMAYYVGEISYPMIAFLMQTGALKYDLNILEPLKGIKWKDINQKNKNNYMKSVNMVLEDLQTKGFDTVLIKSEVERVFKEILELKLQYLGERKPAPNTY